DEALYERDRTPRVWLRFPAAADLRAILLAGSPGRAGKSKSGIRSLLHLARDVRERASASSAARQNALGDYARPLFERRGRKASRNNRSNSGCQRAKTGCAATADSARGNGASQSCLINGRDDCFLCPRA